MKAIAVKTLEFKLSLTLEQRGKVDVWLRSLKSVWNRGLLLLIDQEQRDWRAKKLKTSVPSGLVLRWRKGKLVGSGVFKNRKTGFKSCPIRQSVEVEDTQKLFRSGSYYNNTNAPYLASVPSKYRTGVHNQLILSWKSYKDPNHPGRKPKFKGRKDHIKSLVNGNAGGVSKELKPVAIAHSQNGYVQFPGLGKLHVKGLFKRFDPNFDWGFARIIKEPSGYYLQVAVKAPEVALKDSDKACGIDPGVCSAVTLDNGREYKPANPASKFSDLKRRLQRKLSRQKLKSKNWQKTQARIAKIDERIRRSRRAFNHQLSTKIVQEFGMVAIEDTRLNNMKRKPKPKPRENGKGYEQNGAKRKAGLNRALADVAIGQLREMIETKCDRPNRVSERTQAQWSSRRCYACKELGDRKNKVFKCLNPQCKMHGIKQDADVNAARNHLLNSSLLLVARYPAWAGELKPVGETLSSGDVPLGESDSLLETSYPTRQEAAHDSTAASNPSISIHISRSAQRTPKTFIQLDLWTTAVATDLEAG